MAVEVSPAMPAEVIEEPGEIVEAIFKFYESRGFVPSREEREKMLNL